MEQITKKDGVFYYGGTRCNDAEDVYRRFRDGYHASLGRSAYRRLGRIGTRKERVHEFGFIFDEPVPRVGDILQGKLRLHLLGLVCGSYCWMTGELPQHMTDEEQLDWFDYVLSKGSGLTWKTGKAWGSGRSDKRLNTRYR